jgi:hypothetical protein
LHEVHRFEKEQTMIGEVRNSSNVKLTNSVTPNSGDVSWRLRQWCFLLLAVGFLSSARPALGNGRFPAANQLVIDGADERHLVARTTFGLVQSLDGGAHWSWICESAIQANGFQDPPLLIGDRSAILLGLDEGVQLGDAAGCEWTRAVADFAGEPVIDMAGSSAQIFAAALAQVDGALQARVAASTDGGRHFSTLGSLLPDASPVTIEVAPSRSSRLYLGMLDGNLENGLIARSDDGGSTWLRTAAPLGTDSTYISAVDPADPDRVYLRSMFPSSIVFVSTDASRTWNAAYTSAAELTGFALSPDGRRLALGSSDGVVILDTGGPTPYSVLASYSTPVNCLTWHGTALYACSSDASGGFSIGVSTDARSEFAPLLRFADLLPVSCPSNRALLRCATAPCTIGELFGASCSALPPTVGGDAGSTERAASPAPSPSGGCAIERATLGRNRGVPALAWFGLWVVLRRRRALRAREWSSRSMIAVEAPGWRGATKAHTAGM